MSAPLPSSKEIFGEGFDPSRDGVFTHEAEKYGISLDDPTGVISAVDCCATPEEAKEVRDEIAKRTH